MGRKAIYDDATHIRNREKNRQHYYENRGRNMHRLRYLRKINNITDEELSDFETLEEKIEYAQLVHIRNKYGITVKDIDDNTTVCSQSVF